MNHNLTFAPRDVPIPGPLATLSACWHLFRLTVRRQVISRQTVVACGLAALCLLLVYAMTLLREPSARRLAQNILMPAYIQFLMPMLGICFGASAVGGEREDGTLIYLMITPIPRPLVYLTRFLATAALVVASAGITLWTMCRVAGEPGSEALGVFLGPSLLGAAAYGSLFLLLGAVFRHGTIVSLAYWFFLEALLGNMPGIIKRVSVAFYVRSMIYERGADLEIAPRGRVNREMFLPVEADTAILVLTCAIAALLVLGVTVFTRREYRDLS
jgi:ABC-type transport system involved in multi-copper enzyme maturation permease subunit